MIVAVVLLAVGLVLSAFFSGSETGLYRVTRVRLMLDSLGGDWIARALLWLTNHASLFVATTLVGNNLANWLVSFAIVLAAQQLFPGDNHLADMIAPVVLAPVIFLYGELLPKNMFYLAPNRLLRRCGPALLVCTVLFLPASGLLWLIAQVLERLVGRRVEPLRAVLARRELEHVLQEGREAGILRPAQQSLAQGLLAVAGQPIRQFAASTGHFSVARSDMTRAGLLRLARRSGQAAIPFTNPEKPDRPVGYLCVADIALADSGQRPPLRPLVEIPESDTFIAALMRLCRSGEVLGRVVSGAGETIGFVTPRMLSNSLLDGP